MRRFRGSGRGGGRGRDPENSNLWISVSKFTFEIPLANTIVPPPPLKKWFLDPRMVSTENFSYNCKAETIRNYFKKCLLNRTKRPYIKVCYSLHFTHHIDIRISLVLFISEELRYYHCIFFFCGGRGVGFYLMFCICSLIHWQRTNWNINTSAYVYI